MERAVRIAEQLGLGDIILGGIKNHHAPKTNFEKIISESDNNASASNRMLIIKGSVNYLQILHPLSGALLFSKDIDQFKDINNMPRIFLKEIGDRKELFYDLLANLYNYYYTPYISNYRDVARWILYLPEDTRTPSSPIMAHLQMTSALATIIQKGREFWIAIVDIGGVQDFIKNSKKTVDLWTSSYIMSLISFSGIKSIVDEYGPDHIIMPWLPAIPLARGIIFKENTEEEYLLLPVIPNTFIFMIPTDKFRSLKEIREHILYEMKECWNKIKIATVHGFERWLKSSGADEYTIQLLDKIEESIEKLEFEDVFGSVRLVGIKGRISENGDLEILDESIRLVCNEINEAIGLKEIERFISSHPDIIQYPRKVPLRNLAMLIRAMQYALMISKYRRLRRNYVISGDTTGDLCSTCGIRNAINIDWEEFWDIPGSTIDYLEKLCSVGFIKRIFRYGIDIFFREYFKKDIKKKFLSIPSTSDMSIMWFKTMIYATFKLDKSLLEDIIKEFLGLVGEICKIVSNLRGNISKIVESEDDLVKYNKILSTLGEFCRSGVFFKMWEDIGTEGQYICDFLKLSGEVLDKAFLERAKDEIHELINALKNKGSLDEKSRELIDKIEKLTGDLDKLIKCYKKFEEVLSNVDKSSLAEFIIKRIRDLLAPFTDFHKIIEKIGVPITSAPSDYFTILMADGDNIGKWISGSMLPSLILFYARNGYLKSIIKNDTVIENKHIFSMPIPLSPAILSNISAIISSNSILIKKIIDAFGGFLIYTGGDDVLAILPPEVTHLVYILLRLTFSREYLLMDYHNNRLNVMGMGWRASNSFGIFIADPKFNFRLAIESTRELLENCAKKMRTSLENKIIETKDGLCIAIASRGGILYKAALPNVLIGCKEIGDEENTCRFEYIRTMDQKLIRRIRDHLDVYGYINIVDRLLTEMSGFKGIYPDIDHKFATLSEESSVVSLYNIFMPMEFALRIIYNVLNGRLSRRLIHDLLEFHELISGKLIEDKSGILELRDEDGFDAMERVLIREVSRRATKQDSKENTKLARNLAHELCCLIRTEPKLKDIPILCNILFRVLSKSVLWRDVS